MNPTTIYGDFVASRFKTGTDILNDMNAKGLENALSRLHAVIGIVGELGELAEAKDEENFIEELGDLYFYLHALKQHIGSGPIPVVAISDDNKILERALLNAIELLDLSKKEVVYAKELSEAQIAKFLELVAKIEHYVTNATDGMDMQMVEIEVHNMSKLEKRYPAGYSNEAAALRADKTGVPQ